MPRPAIRLEICVDDPAGAAAAAKGGADRIELCADLGCGGVTPSHGLLEVVRATTELPLVVLVRVRPGPFVYTDAEVRAMAIDAKAAARTGASAIAVGCLDSQGDLHRDHMRRLADAAGEMTLVCHRAFDQCRDAFAAADALVELGFGRVLTSGQAATAMAGAPLLGELQRRFGEALTVLPGAGVRSDNAAALVAATGCRELHGSASGWRSAVHMGDSQTSAIALGTNDDPTNVRFTDGDEVARLVRALR